MLYIRHCFFNDRAGLLEFPSPMANYVAWEPTQPRHELDSDQGSANRIAALEGLSRCPSHSTIMRVAQP